MFKIPILAYHHVVPERGYDEIPWVYRTPFHITEKLFEAHLQIMQQNRTVTINLDELTQLVSGKADKTLQKKAENAVVITFDDGWENNAQFAVPLLQKYNFSATIFVISNAIGRKGYMSAQQLRQINAAGIEVQSHGHRHVALELLSVADCIKELTTSQKIIQDVINQPVRHFSFPLGFYDQKVLQQCSKIYQTCCTSNIGLVISGASLIELPRIMIRKDDSPSAIAKILRKDVGHLKKAKAVQQIKRKFKNVIGLSNYLRLHEIVYGTPPTEVEQIEDLK
jgi:peptidoglycan/xylan/chitin deacetylase (PgdA/CDA1 family)